jgi:hypothetical protein
MARRLPASLPKRSVHPLSVVRGGEALADALEYAAVASHRSLHLIRHGGCPGGPTGGGVTGLPRRCWHGQETVGWVREPRPRP